MSLKSYYHNTKTHEIISTTEYYKRMDECFSPYYAYFGEYNNLNEAQQAFDSKYPYLKEISVYADEKIPAIIVERDYKGIYERFALTPEEFIKEYPEVLEGENPESVKNYLFMKDSDSFTIQPLVHIWYKPTYVGDSDWNTFFTDMADGLSESDIEEGNLAYIREDLWQSLKTYMPHPEKSQKLSLTDMIKSANSRQNNTESKENKKEIELVK